MKKMLRGTFLLALASSLAFAEVKTVTSKVPGVITIEASYPSKPRP